MIKDYLDVENAEGMPALANATFALDFLLAAKIGVQNYVMALAEATRPEVRKALLNQLKSAVALLSTLLTAVEQHHQLSDLASKKDWYKPLLTPQQHVRNDLEWLKTLPDKTSSGYF